MRLALAAFCLVASTSIAMVQAKSEDKQPGDSPHSIGRTVLPEESKGQLQPQGWTGPIETGTAGAPASSPQGGTPPNMQPDPAVRARAS
jgi:hypothetical protein